MLTAIWLVPALGALGVGLLPRRLARPLGLLVSLATLVLSLVLVFLFQGGGHGYQFQEYLPWVSQYGIAYHLGVDGISLWLVVLNALLTVVAVLAAREDMPRLRGFVALLLLMEGAMAGVFLAADLLLFYIFWEFQLIPAYFLVWQWGEGADANRAALKFVLFTLVGSLLALVGVIGEYVYAGHTFDLAQLARHPPAQNVQFGLFLLFALAFAIKVPLFPLHGWLPDAYRAAPVALLVTFAGVMGKTGAYAMLRILVPLFPHPVLWWNWDDVIPVLAVAGIAWGALMALSQRDLKMVVAYSSLSHMGFIVLGIFSFNQQGQQGAVLQMVNHGLVLPALFLLVAWVERRTGTRDRSVLKDLAPRMPVLAGLFLVVTLAALGLPGLNSFVGEFMTLLGAWQLSPWLAVAGCLGLLLAPVYMLRLFQGVMYASRSEDPWPPAGRGPTVVARTDIVRLEAAILVPLVLLMVLLGAYPQLIAQLMPALAFPIAGVTWH
jgi:NADH-quinone oxidoreductase subunit M